MNRKLCQINGDGIGKEVVPVAVNLLERLLPGLEMTQAEAGWETFQMQGESVPDATLNQIRKSGAAIFGAVSSPSKKVEGYQSAILRIRQSLGLNANIRPVDSRFGTRTNDEFSLVVVRENSEGLYSRIEQGDAEAAIAHKVVTRKASIQIGKVAAQMAQLYDKDKITIVHKANVLPVTDGLFRDSVREGIAESEHGRQLIIDELLVDTAAIKLVEEPQRFGVLVTTNLYGDILSDVASYWCGGLALAPSLNLGNEFSVCEPVHGSAPDIAGKGIADPRAAVLSLALLARIFWRDEKLAHDLEAAVVHSLGDGHSPKSTDEFREQFATWQS